MINTITLEQCFALLKSGVENGKIELIRTPVVNWILVIERTTEGKLITQHPSQWIAKQILPKDLFLEELEPTAISLSILKLIARDG